MYCISILRRLSTKDVAYMNRQRSKRRREVTAARRMWGPLAKLTRDSLNDLVDSLGVSVLRGDVQLLHGSWFVTHAGLLRVAHRRGCFSLISKIERNFSDPVARRWVFKATVFKSSKSKGFVGYGDADPSNVSSLVLGAELRIAETRAVNRALRKAYGIGICSVEELGSSPTDPAPKPVQHNHQHHSGSNNGQPRLRDQLCSLIRQHNLDATLVKAYAANFCGTATLSGAGRELVESFISHLSTAAKENRDGLVCKLNSYAQSAQANQ
jgi:hypothetical protein